MKKIVECFAPFAGIGDILQLVIIEKYVIKLFRLFFITSLIFLFQSLKVLFKCFGIDLTAGFILPKLMFIAVLLKPKNILVNVDPFGSKVFGIVIKACC